MPGIQSAKHDRLVQKSHLFHPPTKRLISPPLFPTKSSNLPRSTTAPPLRTTTSSQARIISASCVTASTPHPSRPILMIVSRTPRALCASSPLVASSSTSNFGRLAIALAIAIRCAWPPLRPVPPAPTGVSYPCGRLHIKSSIPAAVAAARIFWIEARGEFSGRA